MGLFNEALTPEAIAIINDNTELVNKHIGNWIRNQRRADSDISKKVLELLTITKRRFIVQQKPISCTPERKRLIEKLVKRGHTWEEFRGVIQWIVPEWHNTKLQRNLQPETIFAASNFQKYLEQAREDWLARHSEKKQPGPAQNNKPNQYEKFLVDGGR